MTEPLIIKGTGIKPKPKPRIIKPVNRLLWKYYLYVFIAFIAVSTAIFLLGGLIDLIVSMDPTEEPLPVGLIQIFQTMYLATWAIIILISIVSIPLYIRSMVFSVHGDEIIVKKGLFNITEKHVPYRTITNLNTKAGILDRLLGIGNVEIQTAGGKGSSGYGPEERLEGLKVYKEVRDYIIIQLRHFRKGKWQYKREKDSSSDQKIKKSIIQELKNIKELFRSEKN